MPKFLTSKDVDKKFFIDLGDGSGAEGVYTRPIPESELKALRKKHTTERAGKFGSTIKDFDDEGFAHDHLVRAITDWQGFTDINESPIPCTEENIIELAGMNPAAFADIIGRIQTVAQYGKVVEEKN